jgi:hypothetical protein
MAYQSHWWITLGVGYLIAAVGLAIKVHTWREARKKGGPDAGTPK